MSVESAPNVSVIIPVYNGAAYLGLCLEALFASDYHSYECIVVNDGSTDGSQAIAERFSMPVEVVNLAGGPYGPAYARNCGATVARAPLLFFLDSDILLAPVALERVVNVFQEHPDVAAIFGSYDSRPRAEGVISQYRNLLHHFVHQNGHPEASTFWAGLGAVRRSVFEKIGGFDGNRFTRPSIEDIDLGYRLRQSGHRILLEKRLQGTHLKRWDFYSLIQTDILRRAIPWSRLILETKHAPDDLNLKKGQRISAALVGVACGFLVLAAVQPPFLLLSALALAAVIGFNRTLYIFFLRQRGIVFAALCIPLHLIYYLYSGLTYVYVWLEFQIKRFRSLRPISALKAVARSLRT